MFINTWMGFKVVVNNNVMKGLHSDENIAERSSMAPRFEHGMVKTAVVVRRDTFDISL